MAQDSDLITILALFGLGYLVLKGKKVVEVIAEIPEAIATGKYASPYTIWKFFTPRGFFITPSDTTPRGGYQVGQE